MGRMRRRLKFFLLKLFYRKLWIQIAAIITIIITIPIILVGSSLIKISQEAVKNSVLTNHKQIVSRAAAETKLFIQRPEDILKATAAMLGRIHAKAWDQQTILVEAVLNQPIFIRAFSVNVSGKKIASSELGKSLNASNSDAVLNVTNKTKTYISEVKFLDNHTPYLTMAVPVKEKGKIAGALIADVNLRGVWDIIDDIKLDETGRAFLVSRTGTLIAHPDKKKVLQNENLKHEQDVQSVLAGDTAIFEIQDTSGEKWFSSYTRIPNIGWSIVLRQKQEEAYLFFKLMKAQAWVIVVLSELVGILLSIVIAWFLIRPIKALTSRVKQVMAGDLDQKIHLKRRDEIGELVTSFNAMRGKLKNAKNREHFSAIGESAAWISHELRNSLVPMKSFIQLFARRHKDKNFVDKFNKLMPSEISRWENMLKELSDFSSSMQLKKIKTDVKELMQNILEVMEERFQEKKINVVYYAGNKDFKIMADSERLYQVFINLIINALNAMSEGDSLNISVDVIEDTRINSPRHIEVKINDTGIGITEDKLGKIFDPFYTATKGGIGLGLPISYRIMKQHGGSIDVESKIGVGTTVILKLPITT